MNAWIGFDLDGTLAYYDGWKGTTHIGPPIEPMVARLKEILDTPTHGVEAKIVTARVAPEGHTEEEVRDAHAAIEQWCLEHIGVIPEITCCKDKGMILLYDDRAVTVEKNTGRILTVEPEEDAAAKPPKTSPCGSCGAPMIWTKTEKGKRNPMDAEPPELGGKFLLYLQEDGTILSVFHGRADEYGAPTWPGHFSSHFSTCPNADDHRRRQGR